MSRDDIINEYCRRMCAKLTLRSARRTCGREIRGHLTERCDALIAQGLGGEEAARQAAAELGDPEELGARLQEAHRPGRPYAAVALIALACCAGLLLQRAAGASPELPQLISLAVGAAVCAALLFTDVASILRWGGWLCAAVLALSLLPALRFSGAIRYGVALLYPLAAALIAGQACGRRRYALAAGALLLAFTALSARAGNLSGVLQCVISGGGTLAFAAASGAFGPPPRKMSRAGYLLALSGSLLLLQTAAALLLFPEAARDALSGGYLEAQARGLLARARFLGPAEGGYSFPDMFHTDYILLFAALRFGKVVFFAAAGLAAVMTAAFAALSLRLRPASTRAVALCVTLTFAVQVLAYISANLGFTLINAASLPFISYGATADLLNFLLAGVLLSALRSGGFEPPSPEPTAPGRLLMRVGGAVLTWAREVIPKDYD